MANPILPKVKVEQQAQPNPKRNDSAFMAAINGCLAAFGRAITLETLQIVVSLFEVYQTVLQTQLAILTAQALKNDILVAAIKPQLALAQQVIKDIKNIPNQLPLTAVQGCAPLEKLTNMVTRFIDEPPEITIPAGVPIIGGKKLFLDPE